MMRSLYSGVSGLRNHQTRMDVIGNNIANVNTTGYKKSRVVFKDTLYQTVRGASSPVAGSQGGTNPMAIGLGMTVGSIDQIHTGAPTTSTGKITDMAVDGNGYFIVNKGGERYYTRAGAFDFDVNGSLVSLTNGYNVQGWNADPTTYALATTADPTNINIAGYKELAAQATQNMVLSGNLDSATGFTASQDEWQTLTFPTIPVGGALGEQFTLTLGAGNTTTPIAVGANGTATAANIQTALEALSNVGTGNVAVTWDAVRERYDIKFQNVLKQTNMPSLTHAYVNPIFNGTGAVASVDGSTISSNEVQTVNVGAATTGTFTLSYGGFATTDIAYDATTAAVEAALQTIPGLDEAGNVTVTGVPGAYTITFGNTLANTNVPQLVPATGVGFDGTMTVNSVDGVSPISEVQTLTLNGATQGTFTLSYGGVSTAPIAFNAPANAVAGNVQAAILAANPGLAGLTVTGLDGGPYTITFPAALGDVPQINFIPQSGGGTAAVAALYEGEAPLSPVAVNEVQTLNINGATSGIGTLTYGAGPAVSVNWNDTAANIQAALIAVNPTLNGNITVTQPVVAGPFRIEFTNGLAGTDIGQMVFDTGTLAGGGADKSILTTNQGQPAANPLAANVKTFSKDAYDSQGNKVSVNYRFFKYEIQPGSSPGVTPVVDPVTRWACDISLDPLFDEQIGYNANSDLRTIEMNGAAPPAAGDEKMTRIYNIQFDENGAIVLPTTSNIGLSINRQVPPPGSGTANLSINVDFQKLSQIASSSSAWAESQDGYGAGKLTSYSIGVDGIITGVYDNGEKKSLAQIALRNFENPGGLQQLGGTLFQETVNSGGLPIGTPSENGLGKISPGSLEMSNVDLSEEFTDMIITQRGFQANSRIITTSDEMLQELVNLKR